MFIINIFHINIRNFHNNNRANKIALTILSQLKITKANIIENFGKENNKITSKNARILKRKGKKRINFDCVYLKGLPIVALTLKVSNKITDVFLKW